MKTKPVKYPRRRTLRLTEAEDAGLARAASAAGLSVSAYLRRKCSGGRPANAEVNAETLRELRRLGGLLQQHFAAVREAASPAAAEELRAALWAVQNAITHLGRT